MSAIDSDRDGIPNLPRHRRRRRRHRHDGRDRGRRPRRVDVDGDQTPRIWTSTPTATACPIFSRARRSQRRRPLRLPHRGRLAAVHSQRRRHTRLVLGATLDCVDVDRVATTETHSPCRLCFWFGSARSWRLRRRRCQHRNFGSSGASERVERVERAALAELAEQVELVERVGLAVWVALEPSAPAATRESTLPPVRTGTRRIENAAVASDSQSLSTTCTSHTDARRFKSTSRFAYSKPTKTHHAAASRPPTTSTRPSATTAPLPVSVGGSLEAQAATRARAMATATDRGRSQRVPLVRMWRANIDSSDIVLCGCNAVWETIAFTTTRPRPALLKRRCRRAYRSHVVVHRRRDRSRLIPRDSDRVAEHFI